MFSPILATAIFQHSQIVLVSPPADVPAGRRVSSVARGNRVERDLGPNIAGRCAAWRCGSELGVSRAKGRP